jgi:hypothetical protein
MWTALSSQGLLLAPFPFALAHGNGNRRKFGGSGGNRHLRVRIVSGLESLSEAEAERPIVDDAANLKQKIRPSS